MVTILDNRQHVSTSVVDEYWNDHTVTALPFKTADESARYLSWLYAEYPLSGELLGIWGSRDQQIVLDYGCGPGNGVVGFSLFTRAAKIIGMDISLKALRLTQSRLGLHSIDENRVSLIWISDSNATIPLENESVDFINCQGVLHHTSDPQAILKEFYRIGKPGSTCTIMVYNAESLYLHLYTAYEKMIVENAFPGLDLLEAFRKNTDGENCPISRWYAPSEFLEICRGAGFDAVYEGGYFSRSELRALNRHRENCLSDERFADEHKDFMKNLTFDLRGYPQYKGKYAGIGGVYKLRRP
jgi:ubiquinone/menaquinone biosynthesis C-methylase UbiE